MPATYGGWIKSRSDLSPRRHEKMTGLASGSLIVPVFHQPQLLGDTLRVSHTQSLSADNYRLTTEPEPLVSIHAEGRKSQVALLAPRNSLT